MKPWLRSLLIVVLAVAVLAGVAAVSFTLGLRAGAQPRALGAGGDGEGPAGEGPAGEGPAFAAPSDGEDGPRLFMQGGGRMGFGWGGGQDGSGRMNFGWGGGEDGIRGEQFMMMRQNGQFQVARIAFLLLRLALTVLVVGALVLGVVAFFRTGGWQRAEAPARRTRR